jgi:biopolymer transport protein ExbB
VKLVRSILSALLVASLAAPLLAQQQGALEKPRSPKELLEQVRRASRAEEEENSRREAEFRAAKDEQRDLLQRALAESAAAERRSEELEREFDENEKALTEVQETLRERMGTLGELFGVVRQAAGETQSVVATSVISAQLPGRDELLSRLAQSRELPSIDDLEKLWLTLQEEMTEQGRVVRFVTTVIDVEGPERERPVVRIGPFNVVSQGRYLQYLPETGKLAELGRQPADWYLGMIQGYEDATAGLTKVAIDPSRGTILSLLIQSPRLDERIRQGGAVGYVTIVLGVFGLLVSIYRLIYLAVVGRKMKAQIGKAQADTGNPLGRVLAIYERERPEDVESLELKLDEAILRETPALERGTNLIKVISVVAPLLGLLGTVTGMIKTFQAITLFGTGDPKLMAGGISEALVTTVLGLTVAIPLVLLHSLVSARTKSLIQILEEESAGVVARRAEEIAAQKENRRVAIV